MNRNLIEGLVVVVIFLLFRFFAKKFLKPEQKNTKGPPKRRTVLGLFIVIVLGPMVEETLFRLPLILIFSKMTPLAWAASIAVSLVFASKHWENTFQKRLTFFEKNPNWRSDYKEVPTEEVLQGVSRKVEEVKRPLLEKMLSFVFSFILGLICAYFGITGGSLFTSILIHGLWNLLSIFVLPIIVSVVCLIVFYFKEVVFMKR